MIKITSISVCLTLVLSLLSFNAFAKMYKCVNEDGEITYSQTACENDQKTEKILGSSKKPQENLEDCKYAGQFAKMVTSQMRSGAEADETFDRYGGINSISKSSLAIINYVYSYKETPDVAAGRISSLTTAKCNAKSFGDVKCEDFPDEFQASIISCDKEEQDAALSHQKMMKQQRPNPDSLEAVHQEPQRSKTKESNTQKQENRQREKERIAECKQKYDEKIEAIDKRMRQAYSGNEGEKLREKRRNLQDDRYSECR